MNKYVPSFFYSTVLSCFVALNVEAGELYTCYSVKKDDADLKCKDRYYKKVTDKRIIEKVKLELISQGLGDKYPKSKIPFDLVVKELWLQVDGKRSEAPAFTSDFGKTIDVKIANQILNDGWKVRNDKEKVRAFVSELKLPKELKDQIIAEAELRDVGQMGDLIIVSAAAHATYFVTVQVY
ncbi:MAG: hypothetical protein KAG61_08385 [Bacteriovoracaceae bacterium]|nr:hypothetical protein [Bacteriovoracaceae bacterium]